MASDFGDVVHEVKRNPWVFGVIYANPEDERLVVPQRSKIGWTLNFANPLSWVIVVIAGGLFFWRKRSQAGQRS